MKTWSFIRASNVAVKAINKAQRILENKVTL